MNIKEKISKKHIIIGTSALVLIAGGITVGVIANNSDEQPTNASVVETQPTTEAVTTVTTTATTKATTTTTTITTTTTTKTTNKPKKTDKKEENKSDSSKTEVVNDNTYEDDNDYSYEEPINEEPIQETPKQEEPDEVYEEEYEEEPVTPDFASGTILSYNPYCDYCYEVTIDPDHYITGHSANIFGEISESGLQNALYVVQDYYSGVEITEPITCYVYMGY